MTPAKILEKARELIAKPEDWFGGEQTPGPKVSKNCALTAMMKVAYPRSAWGEDPPEEYMKSKEFFANANGIVDGIVAYNDSHKHSEVVDAFDRAIELAKSQG